jgi:hypothetical protein
MANSKISALTAATTPVAGTEVLPIVQSSATVKLAISDLTPGLSTITAAKGGTGQTTYAVGDLLYASATTTLSKLADVATGNALISGGVTTAPSWGKIGLTTHVSGVLPVANGGTGRTSSTGSILQVVQNSTVGNSFTTSTTAVDVTNLTVTITPSSTSSKILILSSARCAYTLVVATNVTMTQTLVRTSTTLVTRSLTAASGGGGLQATGSLAIQYVDSPATTSATTYKIQQFVSSASSLGNTDEGWIIAMEISG